MDEPQKTLMMQQCRDSPERPTVRVPGLAAQADYGYNFDPTKSRIFGVGVNSTNPSHLDDTFWNFAISNAEFTRLDFIQWQRQSSIQSAVTDQGLWRVVQSPTCVSQLVLLVRNLVLLQFSPKISCLSEIEPFGHWLLSWCHQMQIRSPAENLVLFFPLTHHVWCHHIMRRLASLGKLALSPCCQSELKPSELIWRHWNLSNLVFSRKKEILVPPILHSKLVPHPTTTKRNWRAENPKNWINPKSVQKLLLR